MDKKVVKIEFIHRNKKEFIVFRSTICISLPCSNVFRWH